MSRYEKIFRFQELLDAARLAKDGLTQKEIAAKLQINPPQVSDLLEEAEKRGILQIHFDETRGNHYEAPLREEWPFLKRVLVAENMKAETEAECHALFRRFGALAADYFEEIHRSHSKMQHPNEKKRELHVGVAGGPRCLEFALAVPVKERPNVYVHVTALAGRGMLDKEMSHTEPSVAANILWTHCGSFAGHCEYSTVEPYDTKDMSWEEARLEVGIILRQLRKKRSVQNVLQNMRNLDVVFAGFGFGDVEGVSRELKNMMTMESLIDSIATPGQMSELDCAGDYCYCPYDNNGNPLPDEWRFFLTPGDDLADPKSRGIHFFKHMVNERKTVVGFGGPHTIDAIRAALKGHIVNALVIDEDTAKKLLGK